MKGRVNVSVFQGGENETIRPKIISPTILQAPTGYDLIVTGAPEKMLMKAFLEEIDKRYSSGLPGSIGCG